LPAVQAMPRVKPALGRSCSAGMLDLTDPRGITGPPGPPSPGPPSPGKRRSCRAA
jgi:hypothetical protein